MPRASKIRVMISSRCNDLFPVNGEGRPLSEIRRELKGEIEALTIFNKQIFEVWINEDTAPQAGTEDSWEVCLNAVKECDILIVLCNGNAGWAQSSGELGICHAELMAGLSQAPGKIRLISLGNVPITDSPEGRRNQRFQAYIEKQKLFRGGAVTTIDELKARVKEAVHDALIALAQAGVREVSKGKFHSGEALDWSRLDFDARHHEMCQVLKKALGERPDTIADGENVVGILDGKRILFVPNAIPAAISVGPAKEMVGQPFLKDHELVSFLGGGRRGPVHIIACHKTATETQAMKLLGFPDATIVSAPFGVFVADNIQKVQIAFIVNCRDESTTRHGVQRFFEWMSQTGEDKFVVNRASARVRIVRVIANERGQ